MRSVAGATVSSSCAGSCLSRRSRRRFKASMRPRAPPSRPPGPSSAGGRAGPPGRPRPSFWPPRNCDQSAGPWSPRQAWNTPSSQAPL
jgi:hypothetical protein